MTIKTDNIQIGQNVTATQNFTLTQNADGTCKLARGNVGATTQDVLTVDASGNVAVPANTTNKLVSASGSAPVYGCRAWCVFNGTTTGTNAPIAGGNVTSVTRTAAGQYTINLTTAISSANYSVIATAKDDGGGFTATVQSTATGSCTIETTKINPLSISDSSLISVSIFT